MSAGRANSNESPRWSGGGRSGAAARGGTTGEEGRDHIDVQPSPSRVSTHYPDVSSHTNDQRHSALDPTVAKPAGGYSPQQEIDLRTKLPFSQLSTIRGETTSVSFRDQAHNGIGKPAQGVQFHQHQAQEKSCQDWHVSRFAGSYFQG